MPARAAVASAPSSVAPKKPASFVTPTRESAHALTLSTVVTDAADLHFAVVLAGHAPLDAQAIKSAVEQCSALPPSSYGGATDARGGGARQLGREKSPPSRIGEAAVVRASTVAVAKAQKVERCISGLQPNTSYDVYFVAEVSGSNGVFGPVQSVLRSATHPEPPAIALSVVRAADASATTIVVNATLSAPGRVYFAFVPSAAHDAAARQLPTPSDLVTNRSFSELPSVFALHDADDWGQLEVHKAVHELVSATLYDVLFVTEAVGGGDVRSNVTRLPGAARTHALAPDVARLACSPQDASAEALVVEYALAFDARDVGRASAENLHFFTFNVHYTATKVLAASSAAFDDKAPLDARALSPANAVAAALVDGDAAQTTVNGTFLFGNFSSVKQLREQLALPQRTVITGLANATSYHVTLVAETAFSHGVVGREKRTTVPSTTHERAPQILSASVAAANGSVTSLVVTAELSRRGNMHYLVVPRASNLVRHSFRDAPSIAHLAELVRRDESDFVFGVTLYDAASRQPAASSATEPGGSSPSYTSSFVVDGLRDATAYTVVVMPETHGSHGVFGKPFEQLLEAQTNEKASDVALRTVGAMDGSTTSIELTVDMSKPNDVLFYCLSTKLPLVASKDSCREADKESLRLLARGGGGGGGAGGASWASGSTFSLVVGNLTEDTVYYASVFAENALRNDVLSAASSPTLDVKTHKRAPALVSVQAQPVAASTDRIATTVVATERCLVHYAVIETPTAGVDNVSPSSSESDAAAAEDDTPSPETIVKERWMMMNSSSSPSPRRVEFVSQGLVFADNANERFVTAKLKANTTYTLFVTTETSLAGNSSGVYGAVRAVSATTFAAAPKIVKATVDPIPDRTDSVVVTANLSAPGVVHYFLSDVDFADPAAIRRGGGDSESFDDRHQAPVAASPSPPHTLRGEFSIARDDMAMEIINGTNDSQPVQPLMFVSNTTVRGLRSGATYHVSLTTETTGSDGVFGDFPPPILVTTHLPAPTLRASTLAVKPKAGSSSCIAVELELSRFGEVHYALFFRELMRDRSDDVFDERRRRLQEEQEDDTMAAADATALNATAENAIEAHVWPPAASNFSLASLNASLLKSARVNDLGRGVWENGTISVSRDDVFTGRLTVKEIKDLPPNAVFDLCLVSETAGSDGVFDWVDSDRACYRVKTHADYSNQSMLLDEVAIAPVDGQTGSVRIELAMSKLPGAPAQVFPPTVDDHAFDNDELLRRFELAAGRTPYFILADGKEARRDYTHNSFSPHSDAYRRDKFAAGFKEAVVGTNGVAATGVLTRVHRENASFLTLVHEVHGLVPNHPYFLFFAYETSGSDGVFTKVNPHKLRPNRSSTAENDPVEVTTHEAAPALLKYAALPTFGNTTRVTVKFDVVCASCRQALVHALVYPEWCARPSIDLLRDGVSAGEVDAADESHDGEDASSSDTRYDAAPATDHCHKPLARRKFVVDMNEREHKVLNAERDVTDRRMRANTTYKVFLATETAGSNGVLSDRFVETAVTTFAPAPAFAFVHVAPRKGSTTEIALEFALETPGEVHFMCGVSGNPELNVTSPYNVSRKSRPEKNAPKQHDYARDIVRTQRSMKVHRAGAKHVVVLDYLTAGTQYDVFVVLEAPESNGVYGRVHEFKNIGTHANPPILLAHTAHPTPGSTASLTLGFRVDAPGAVHFSVVETTHWPRTTRVARASDVYGNRLAIQEQLVAQASVAVDESSMGAAGDSGWREVNISVPRPGANYTVYLVTETAASDGVFGAVASHRDVQSHGEPPTVLKLAVTSADARVDALKGSVQLAGSGHVHYLVLPHRRRLSERAGAVVAQGVVDVTDTSESLDSSDHGRHAETTAEDPKPLFFSADFVIEQLTEGTVFDLYFRCETLHSFGVLSSWTHFPISARTHGLPPDVLEEVECAVSPSCDAIGRDTCTRTPNVCGECREGFAGALGSSNEPCVPTDDGRTGKKKAATIKISGVRVNPLAWLESDSQSQEATAQEEQTEQPEPLALFQPKEQPQLEEECVVESLDVQGAESEQQREEQDAERAEPAPLDPPLEDPLPDTIKDPIDSVATERNQTQQQRSEPLGDDAAAPAQHETQKPRETTDSQSTRDAAVHDTEETLLEDDDLERPSSSSISTEPSYDSAAEPSTGGSGDEKNRDDSDPTTAPLEMTDADTDSDSEVSACPMHAHTVAPGQCECLHGYELSELTGACALLPESAELSRPQMPFALEASA
ncbi:hypothetical protein PybrP1_008655 [[Pythium] brassicae (nom. inval.)]|nr:hypothetical protein PybrP1_008655 [[Pythium] brassicae (nom. inval.)]